MGINPADNRLNLKFQKSSINKSNLFQNDHRIYQISDHRIHQIAAGRFKQGQFDLQGGVAENWLRGRANISQPRTGVTISPLRERVTISQDTKIFDKAIEQLRTATNKTINTEKQLEINSWVAKYSPSFKEENLKKMSNVDLFQLMTLLAKIKKYPNIPELTWNIHKFDNRTTQFRQIIDSHNSGTAIKEIKNLPHLTIKEKSIALAFYMECREVKIKDVKKLLTTQEWVMLAPHLRYVDLEGVEDVSFIEQLLKNCSNCEHLICNNPKLKELPELPVCKKLFCQGCDALTALPSLPLCEVLSCKKCANLTTLPALPLCRYLNCSKCPMLSRVPALPLCRDIFCKHCINLTELPALPVCNRIYCEDCTNLVLPEMPFDAQVFSSDLKFTKLEVHLENLAKNPKETLLELGRQFLLNKNPFPNIYYFVNNERSEAIDVGGVRRDLITRLAESLFKETNDPGHLKIENGLPLSDNEENTKDSYRTLGKIFALCYPKNSYFKTGALFSDEAYAAITAMKNPSTLTDESVLESYLHMIRAPQSAHRLADMKAEVPELSETDLVILSYLIDTSGDIPISREYFLNPENKAAFRKILLQEAQKDERLRACAYLAKSMKESLGENAWNSLCKEGSQMLKDRIEGKLSVETILPKLAWTPTKTISKDLVAKTKNYLINWIKNANKEDLRLFVRAVSSNNTMSLNKLNIEILDRDPNLIPITHTCSFTMELPANYPSQEHFDAKLRILLTEGLAGSGFQEI
jgi:hypothetical protein